jgi:hypothetical protein
VTCSSSFKSHTCHRRSSCNNNTILHAFLRGAKKRRCEAVAYLLTRAGEGHEDGGGGDRLEVEYFDEIALREFLHTRADITDGMLQRCVSLTTHQRSQLAQL